jgi:hypothetical protein
MDALSLCDGFTRITLAHCDAAGGGIHAINKAGRSDDLSVVRPNGLIACR